MNTPDPYRDEAPGTHGDPHVHHVDVGIAPPVTPASTSRMVIIAIGIVVVFAIFYVTALLPRRAVTRELVTGVGDVGAAPTVQVTQVERATVGSVVELPGTIEAQHEGAIYARVSGYVKSWHADIGMTVKSGDVLAVLDAPELAQNAEQAKHQLAQVRAALGLAKADLARWKGLAADSAVSVQELDQKQAAYDAAVANEGAAAANLQRLMDLESYTKVRAPFAGVVTARNVDIGSLITPAGATSAGVAGGAGAGAGSMFRIAETDTVRIYVPVPENYAMAMNVGLSAEVTVQEIPGKAFIGHVLRTSRSLDAGSRTMLTEVDIANPGFKLLPGMYATVRMQFPNTTPPVMIPATALVIRSIGPQVLVVESVAGSATAIIHLRAVQIGRDYGATVEILSGIEDGTRVVTTPTPDLMDGMKVVVATPPPTATPAGTVPGAKKTPS